jgi:hypothetical protein
VADKDRRGTAHSGLPRRTGRSSWRSRTAGLGGPTDSGSAFTIPWLIVLSIGLTAAGSVALSADNRASPKAIMPAANPSIAPPRVILPLGFTVLATLME